MDITPVIAKKKDVKEWLPLKSMMQNLKEILEKDGQVDVIQFSLEHNVAAVVKGINSSIQQRTVVYIKKTLKRNSSVCISRQNL